MFVDLLRWVEHDQKVLAVTGMMLTHCLDKIGLVSLKLDDYSKYSTAPDGYIVHTLNFRIKVTS